MTIDEAVKQVVKKTLTDGKYCSEDDAKTIAQDAARQMYEHFQVDIQTLHSDLEKMQAREDRMWDILHASPPSRTKKLMSWLLFWRKQ
jgi:hypothetical protein